MLDPHALSLENSFDFLKNQFLQTLCTTNILSQNLLHHTSNRHKDLIKKNIISLDSLQVHFSHHNIPSQAFDTLKQLEFLNQQSPEYWIFAKRTTLNEWEQFIEQLFLQMHPEILTAKLHYPSFNIELNHLVEQKKSYLFVQLPIFYQLFYRLFNGGFFSIPGKIDVSNHLEFQLAKEKSNYFLTLKQILNLYQQFKDHYYDSALNLPFTLLPFMQLTDNSYLLLNLFNPEQAHIDLQNHELAHLYQLPYGAIVHANDEKSNTWKMTYRSFFHLVQDYLAHEFIHTTDL